jgi:glycosyltransferase involved in cell wall biosynthesis
MEENHNSNGETKHPLISVVMPVYDREQFVAESIESIINQTCTNWELIIVDDASTDRSVEIIESYTKLDKRIKLIKRSVNRYKEVRNIGLREARGAYYAAHDSDDISRKDRFKKQVDFLEQNPEVALVGSDSVIIDVSGFTIGSRKYPKSHEEIIQKAIKFAPFCHSSVMVRMDIMKEMNGYSEIRSNAEDYNLWLRILKKYKSYNLEEHLLQYRLSGNQVKNRVRETLLNTIRIQSRMVFQKPYFSIYALLNLMLETVLLMLPSVLILFLFKKMRYTTRSSGTSESH